MLGDGWLGDSELSLNDLAECPGGELAVSEQLQDAAAHRIAEYVERVHGANVSATTYISKVLDLAALRRHLCRPDDDALPRRAWIDRRNGLVGRLDCLWFRGFSSAPMTVRIDLDP